jgi:uncharacterized membrane protein YhhN
MAVASRRDGQAAFTAGLAGLAGLASFLAGHVVWIIALRQRPGGGCLRARPIMAVPHLAAFGTLKAW